MKTSSRLGFIPIAISVFVVFAGLAPAAVTNLSKKTANQTESFIVINPTNPQNIVAFANEDASNNTFRAYTNNGGASWTSGDILIGGACCDAQAVTFDSFGNLFVVYIDSGLSQINVIDSTDGGATFSAPVTVGSGSIDQPSIAAGKGSLWVDWNQSGSIRVRGVAVSGLGLPPLASWLATQTPPSASGSYGGIAVGPGTAGSGKVIIVYMTQSTGDAPSTIWANVDPDGLGASNFGSRITVTATNVGDFDYIPAQSGRSIDTEAGVAWDTSGGPFNGRLYLVYTEETPDESNDTNILVRTSTNDGTSWSSAVKVNDDATTRSQFLPYISLDEKTGAVGVTFHDSRNDNGVAGAGGTNAVVNDDAQFFASYSTDGGATWAPNVMLSAAGSNFSNDNAAANGIDYGDYVGTDTYCGVIWGAWADNSNSTGDNPQGTHSKFDLYANSLTFIANACTPPPPVGDGNPSRAAGTAAKFVKPGGSSITATWDKTTCAASNAVIMYGNIGTYTGYAGYADCNAGASGSKTFTPPAGNVWFNIVWENASFTSGHPGYATSGARTWTTTGSCGVTTDTSSDTLCN